jgi:tetratricopeptide (TPR) repeat protein
MSLWRLLAQLTLPVVALVFTSAIAAPRPASNPASQPASSPASVAGSLSQPWSRGLSTRDKQRARAHFVRGNRAYGRQFYAEAVKRYNAALAIWKHPAVQFNAAQCLIKLERPLAAYELLVSALRYGKAPLGAVFYQRALASKKMLESQLATIEISCREPGATVSLNGKRLFSAPGKVSRRVLPGELLIVASKPGFVTTTKRVIALPRKHVATELVMQPEAVMTRRWSRWVPWTVIGVGAVTALSGIGFLRQAKSDLDDFSKALAEDCPTGCPLADVNEKDQSRRSRGKAGCDAE